MRNLRLKFTKWYVRKGYIFGYDYSNVEMVGGDDIFPPTPATIPPCVYDCPWYIKPLLFLFSPSVYYAEYSSKYIYEGFVEGLNSQAKVIFMKEEAEKALRSDTE